MCRANAIAWHKRYCACAPSTTRFRRCLFAHTPKTGGETVATFLATAAPDSGIDVGGTSCHTVPRAAGAHRRPRRCAGLRVPDFAEPDLIELIERRSSACFVTMMREPTRRFESAWRFGFAVARRAKLDTADGVTWAALTQRFSGGATQFVEEARASNRSVAQMLRHAAGVARFNPSAGPEAGDGVCCQSGLKETPLFSPQKWWVAPPAARAAAGREAAELHVLCTESLAEDLRSLLLAVSHPAAHQPLQLSHVHATKRTKLLARVSDVTSEANREWLRGQYAEDVRLYRKHCLRRGEGASLVRS